MTLLFYRTLNPTIGRWLQVDPKAESLIRLTPYNSIGGNPVSFSDPGRDLPILAIAAIGAATGVLFNGQANVNSDRHFFDGAGKAALFGEIGAVASFGIGTIATQLFGTAASFGKAVFQFGAHGLRNGLQSHFQGGSLGKGFVVGAISSGLSSGGDGLDGGKGEQIAATALGGGLAASFAGGDFFEGFGQGLAVGVFNHALHAVSAGGPGVPPTKEEIMLFFADEIIFRKNIAVKFKNKYTVKRFSADLAF